MVEAGRRLKIGVFGGGRGVHLASIVDAHPDAELVAICEGRPEIRAMCETRFPDVKYYEDYDEFLKHDMDAVIIANYAHEHALAAIKAMDLGLHVLSEVMACSTLAEGVSLARAVERNKVVYTYAENYCFFRFTQEMQRVYKSGELGEFQYGEGEYVHGITDVVYMAQLKRGDPGHWRNWVPATFYCSHALGPVIKITGTRPVKVVGLTSPNRNGQKFGRRGDDCGVIMCQMSNGAVVKALQGGGLRREPPSVWYCIYGTKGCIENNRWPNMEYVNLFLVDDKGTPYQRTYLPEFPYRTELSKKIGGHGGSDFYTIDGFIQCILRGKPNPIDVYEALDMTLPGLLAFRSAYEGSVPYEVPDFRNEDVRKKYENDNWSVDPKYAGPGQPTSSSAHGKVEIDPSVYEKEKRIFEEWYKRVDHPWNKAKEK